MHIEFAVTVALNAQSTTQVSFDLAPDMLKPFDESWSLVPNNVTLQVQFSDGSAAERASTKT